MRFIVSLLLLCIVSAPSSLFAADQPRVAACISSLDTLLDRAIAQNLIAGGVAVVGNRDGILATAARGQLSPAPGAPALNERTMFDVASLTKVIATAPAVMKLLDEGRINLSDPISRWFPEFAQAGHGEVTILNLLTHTSGLDDFTISSSQPVENAIRKAAAERSRAGSHFHYADINFILLGEIVHRVSGQTLDNFCREEIFAPLGAQEMMFLPPRQLAGSIAATSGSEGGVVQDCNARRLGGVAGHAGLFASAYDLSRYARMILAGGALDDKRIFSPQTIAKMTTPYACNNGTVRRGLGWDMASAFSAPKASFFSDASFGHTGYSGSSIWIDPQQDIFVILLTRRVNYHDKRDFNQLRREVSTIAAADLKGIPYAPATPSAQLAKAEAELDEAVSKEVEIYERDGVLVATNIHKAPQVAPLDDHQQHPQKSLVRNSEAKHCSKTVRAHRASHVVRVAKADLRRSLHAKKRHAIVRS